jgi:DNA-binding beta-propeller fold protein YncE
MNFKTQLFHIALLFFATMVCGQVEAKDLIINMGYGAVSVVDTETDEITDVPVKGAVRGPVISSDEKFLYVTSMRKVLHKIDLEKLRIVKSIELEKNGWERFIYGMALSEDGKTAYAHTFNRRADIDAGEVVIGAPTVLQFDLNNGKILRSVEVPHGIYNIALVEGGQKLYAAGQDIYTIDISKKEMTVGDDPYPLFGRINYLPLFDYTTEHDGDWLNAFYSAEGLGLLNIDTKNGEITETLVKGEPVLVYSACYSPDKTKAYAVMDKVYVIDLKTQKVIQVAPLTMGVAQSAIPTSDGKKLYVGAGGSTITVFDTETMRPIKVLQVSSDGFKMRRVTL